MGGVGSQGSAGKPSIIDSHILPFIAANLSFRMDKNKILNYHLPKTIHNFHFHISIKTTSNNKFIIFCRFLSPKQH